MSLEPQSQKSQAELTPQPHDEESFDPATLRQFSRSPHPYHRKQSELQFSTISNLESGEQPSASPPWQSQDGAGAAQDGVEEQDPRRPSKTSSESGTDAEDETYHFIRALPAPPLKPRKGLRGAKEEEGLATPLLTPSTLEDYAKAFQSEYFPTHEEDERKATSADEEARQAKAKFFKRRQAEVIRRLCECAFVAAVGLSVIRPRQIRLAVREWQRELAVFACTYLALIGLYPVRLVLRLLRQPNVTFKDLPSRMYVPSAFDPAPILYPVFLPLFVALSILPAMDMVLLPNIMLGLASLPSALIPGSSLSQGFEYVHWLISMLPLFISEHTDLWSRETATTPYKLKVLTSNAINPEVLVCLFAVQQALLPPLHYLTTTSLLPAELHLFSISLINVFLFSDSPQSIILRTLLWIGGLALFVLCGQVLQWNIELARVPQWRFRHVGNVIMARQSFISSLSKAVKTHQQHNRVLSDMHESSKTNNHRMDNPYYAADKPTLRLDVLKAFPTQLNGGHNTVQSAVEPNRTSNGLTNARIARSNLPPMRKRRNTMPAVATPPDSPLLSKSPSHKRSRSTISQASHAMTSAQASLRKWAYAGYVYLVMVALVLGPIRTIVSRYALGDHEPFGWAISYLFGEQQLVRDFVKDWGLDAWVPLPSLTKWSIDAAAGLGRAEHLRQAIIGEANTRLLLCAYCVAVVACGLLAVFSLSAVVEVDTRRKVFHGTMVAMLMPIIFIDPAFVSLALALVLAIFLLLDLIRASQLPPLSGPIAKFLTPYVDGRDLRGPVVVSHIFLLIGCAIPLWLSLAAVTRTGDEPWKDWDVESRDVSMLSGVVCVGMGDAAASLIGRRFGRRKWLWAGGKSLEGSLAFAVAVTVGLVSGKAWLWLGQWHGNEVQDGWFVTVLKSWIAACGASFMEAVLTGGNDNVIVPVVLWLLVRGVGL